MCDHWLCLELLALDAHRKQADFVILLLSLNLYRESSPRLYCLSGGSVHPTLGPHIVLQPLVLVELKGDSGISLQPSQN